MGVDARRSRGLPPRADAGELRVSIDLDPPALVVGEVPMERVELGERHAVDHPLHILDRLEMARSEERRVGEECVRPCRSRWAPCQLKKNNSSTQTKPHKHN